jgi:hypothetical protein
MALPWGKRAHAVQDGVDDLGNPRYETRWELVHHTRRVCDEIGPDRAYSTGADTQGS